MMDGHGAGAVGEAGPGHEAEYVKSGGLLSLTPLSSYDTLAVMVTRIALVAAGNEEQEPHRTKRGHGEYYIQNVV